MDNSYNEIKIPAIKMPDETQGFFNAPIEDVQLEVGNNRDISGMQYFAMDIWGTSGATGDGSYRDIILVGFNGDKSKSYTQEIITGLGSTTAAITKTYTIDTPVNNIIKVPAGKICKVTVSFGTTTQLLRVFITGIYRYIKGNSITLTNTNRELFFINSGIYTNDVTLRFATSASDRPDFGVLIEII